MNRQRSPRVAMLTAAATALLSLAGCGDDTSKTASSTPAGSVALLPRNAIVPVSVVSQYFPDISTEANTGPNETSVGSPIASRSVVFVGADGKKKVTLSVDQYANADAAAAAYQTAVEGSKAAPGFKPAAPPNLGQEGFAGTSQVGAETHFGLGARDGGLIMSVTHAGDIPVTPDNSKSLISLGSLVLTSAKQALPSGGKSTESPMGPFKVVTTFGVGGGPLHDVASDPSTHTAYVTSGDDNSLYVIGAASRTAAIKVGEAPVGVAVDPATQTAYVTGSNAVSIVDIASGAITGTIPVGNDPQWIEVNSTSRTVYVANVQDNTVSVIDAASRKVTATIKVGNVPGKMGADPDSHLLYVSNRGDNTVSVVDPLKAAVIDTIAVGRGPSDVALDSSTRTAFVPNEDDDTVSVIDLEKRTVVGTIKVGDRPVAATVDPEAHAIFVTNSGSASVSVIDSEKRAVTGTIEVGDGPQTVAADPSTHTAWVVNFKANSISVIQR